MEPFVNSVLNIGKGRVCAARSYKWLDFSCLFISCTAQNLKCRKFSLMWIDCDYSWSLGSGAPWGSRMLRGYRFSVIELKADMRWRSCFLVFLCFFKISYWLALNLNGLKVEPTRRKECMGNDSLILGMWTQIF